ERHGATGDRGGAEETGRGCEIGDRCRSDDYGECGAIAENRPVPGTVLRAGRDQLIVATGDGAIRICEVQPPGKKPLEVAAFINGYRLRSGQRFGRPDVAE
ncbi:MAG: hypothetical protein Q4C47_09665, partial [Planctomycetia bacterium]|nr:hypothetical protein [Planctomycetia bacterium]